MSALAPAHDVRSGALAGIGLVVVATALFATLDTTAKWVSTSVPVLMALWFRYFFQALSTTLVVLPMRGRAVFRTAHPRYQALRGLLLLVCSVLAFFSLKYLPVGEFTAIVMITPLAITLVAATVLKEPVSPLRWLLVAGGFIGTLIIVRPSRDDFDWTLLLPLCLVVSNAGFQTLTSKLAKTEDPLTMHFYTGWIGALLATLALPFVWASVDSVVVWVALVMMGLLGSLGHFLLILGYARAPAATLTPYLYGQIGFAMIGGWVAFAHVPDAVSLLGIGMIAVCGALGAWMTVRERRTPVEPVEA